jgi:hypothetical protein
MLEDHHKLLLNALINPDCLIEYNTADWELLIRLARRVKLLGHLALELDKINSLEKISVRVANQLRSNFTLAKKLQQQAYWELNRILWALKEVDLPVIALKGVAYSLAGLPESEGRLYVDLDLMVLRDDITRIESILIQKRWKHQALSAYDDHYYREWSHEIPPLIHTERETEVDIHHTISLPTSRLKINAELLIEAAIDIEGQNLRILSPVDMVLHCAVNLFQNNELADDLRDLLDLHHLLLFFSNKEQDFWKRLTERANQLRSGRSLSYGLHYCQLFFNTPVPEDTASNLNEKPGFIVLWIMNRLVPLALLPLHPDKPSRRANAARLILYMRSHWIRMPFYLLLPHLIYKSVLAVFPRMAGIFKKLYVNRSG